MLYSVLYSLVNLVLPLTSHLSFRQKKAVVLGVITMSVRIVRQHGKEMFSVGLLPQLSLQGGIDLYFAEIFSPSFQINEVMKRGLRICWLVINVGCVCSSQH